MRQRILFGSRKSKLALAQTNWVMEELRKRWPNVEFLVRTITTTGDRALKTPLSRLAGKGVFVKEIEEALLAGDVDIAVHSMKDLPTVQPDGLTIAGVPRRADPRDALVSASGTGLKDLPEGSRIGTSSLRRSAQVRHLRPDLQVVDIRGNVDTRLRKVQEGLYAATILAVAGLQRLGWKGRATQIFDPEEFLPAPGQGALGIEIRQDDAAARRLAESLTVEEDFHAVIAERAFLAALGGGCKVPIAALGKAAAGRLTLSGLVASADGSILLHDRVDGSLAAAEDLGLELAHKLKEQGAEALLAAEAEGIGE